MPTPDQANLDLENIWITIVIHLFILSLISERFVNFIKLNFQRLYEVPFLSVKLRKKAKKAIGNFRDKKDSETEEKLRERGILNWAILCAFGVAFITNADLFYLLNNGKLPGKLSEIETFWGIILTTLFISLGSKFWHDLLDLLLQVKNLKSKLADVSGAEFSNIKEFDEFINSFESDAVRQVIDSNRLNLHSFENVMGVGHGNKNNQPFCEVLVSRRNERIPKHLVYFYPPNKPKLLPVMQLETSSIITTFLEPAEEIGNTLTSNIDGSIGCFVRYINSNERYFLTCYHVVRTPGQPWELYDNTLTPNARIEQPDDSNTVVGVIKEAKRTMRQDTAIIKLLNNVPVNENIPRIGSINGFREVVPDDKNNTRVRKNGKATDLQEGLIVDLGTSANIEYPDGSMHTLFNLIQIKPSDSTKKFSDKGDSGSVVVDSNNIAIGIVVAGNNDFSYAIPISTIFNEFNLTF